MSSSLNSSNVSFSPRLRATTTVYSRLLTCGDIYGKVGSSCVCNAVKSVFPSWPVTCVRRTLDSSYTVDEHNKESAVPPVPCEGEYLTRIHIFGVVMKIPMQMISPVLIMETMGERGDPMLTTMDTQQQQTIAKRVTMYGVAYGNSTSYTSVNSFLSFNRIHSASLFEEATFNRRSVLLICRHLMTSNSCSKYSHSRIHLLSVLDDATSSGSGVPKVNSCIMGDAILVYGSEIILTGATVSLPMYQSIFHFFAENNEKMNQTFQNEFIAIECEMVQDVMQVFVTTFQSLPSTQAVENSIEFLHNMHEVIRQNNCYFLLLYNFRRPFLSLLHLSRFRSLLEENRDVVRRLSIGTVIVGSLNVKYILKMIPINGVIEICEKEEDLKKIALEKIQSTCGH